MTKRARPFSIQDYSDARKQAVGPLRKFGINSPDPRPSAERIAELRQVIDDSRWAEENWENPRVREAAEAEGIHSLGELRELIAEKERELSRAEVKEAER